MQILEFILCKLFVQANSEATPPGVHSRPHNPAISSLIPEAHQIQTGTSPQALRPTSQVPVHGTSRQNKPWSDRSAGLLAVGV